MYQEHDVVILRHDLPESGLVKGEVGVVVGVYAAGGYEVEFTTTEGVAVVTLKAQDIRRPLAV